MVNFNSYHGCTRCTGEGEYRFNKMIFPKINCRPRTDLEFRNRKDEDHHKEDTPLELLPIDMIKDFIVADSLHLLHVGVMKKLLLIWTTGMYTYEAKWSASVIRSISLLLIESNSYLPKEIHRATRGLDCLKFWKGSEFRTFLMYLGIVVLKDFMESEIYEHFLLLFCAVTICSSSHYQKLTVIAKELFEDYIKKYKQIYGLHSITINIHSLSHVVEDVDRFGPLPSFSTYRFESHLGYIKNLLRQGNTPLAQCAKRIIEISKATVDTPLKPTYPILGKSIEHPFQGTGRVFTKLYVRQDLLLTNKSKDKWFLTKQGEIVSMIYATSEDDEIKIFGQSIKNIENFFQKPIKSSYLDIYSCKENLNNVKMYSLNQIKCKLVSLKYHDQIIFIPLIHSFDIFQK